MSFVQFQSPKNLFLTKLFLLIGLSVLFGFSIVSSDNLFLKVFFQLLLGVMFAHAVELSHEMIHQNHFGKSLGDCIGFILGLPMLVNYSRYFVTHSFHHRAVGTPSDKESFSYNTSQLGAPATFILYISMYDHFVDVVRNIYFALAGNNTFLIDRMGEAGSTAPEKVIKKISYSYILMFIACFVAFGFSTFRNDTFAVEIWLIPLLFAAPVHALIELPEHWNCDSGSNNIIKNSRTIIPSAFSEWITNGNCWHVEHHLKPAMPMNELPNLHRSLSSQIIHLNTGYLNFYSQFFNKLLHE